LGREFDLFGEPLPLNRGKPGRNDHVPTAENANKIRLLLVAKWTLPRIAEEIGISVPTLRKHYFASGKINVAHAREMAAAEVKGRTLLQLSAAADAGNVSAMKELRSIADQAEIDRLPKPAKKPKPEGKKARTAERARKPAGSWGELLPPEEQVH
jgi:hypothetical protein